MNIDGDVFARRGAKRSTTELHTLPTWGSALAPRIMQALGRRRKERKRKKKKRVKKR